MLWWQQWKDYVKYVSQVQEDEMCGYTEPVYGDYHHRRCVQYKIYVAL